MSDTGDHSMPHAANGGRQPRAVFFDVDGVLIHGYHAVPEKRRRWDTHLKPQIEFFERIAMAIGPQQTPPLFFDDSESVVNAAKAFGWEGVLYEELDDCRAHPWVMAVIDRRP